MHILPPHKISSEILDVIYEAKEHLVIVSPYVDFKYWQRLSTELSNAKKKGITIDFFVRNESNNSNSWEAVENLGITPRLVNNLHAKFYMNEKQAVISSMNLLSSSNSNSIEIGTKVTDANGLAELRKFVDDFIITNENSVKPSEEDLYLSKERFITALENYIANFTNSRARAYFKNGAININACSNQFFINIDKVRNLIEITPILSGDEADRFNGMHKQYFNSDYFTYELIRGGNGSYDLMSATSKVRLSNSFLDNLRVEEKKTLIPEIAAFIKSVKNYKDECYKIARQ